MIDKVVWTVDTEEAEDYFEFAGYKARDMRDPLQSARTILLHHIARTFETEGAWAHVDWPALNPEYAIWKAGEVGHTRMLDLYGPLKRMATSRGTTHIEGNDTLRYELDMPAYAEVHQHGATWFDVNHKGDAYKVEIPARPFVVETLDLKLRIRQAFLDWLLRTRAANRARSKSVPSVNAEDLVQ